MKIPKRILERRRSVRIEESLPFKIGHEGYEIEARTINISLHGAMCAVEESIPLMTQLKIGLTLKDRQIRLKGVVVRRDEDPLTGKFQIGIFFSDISPKDSRALQDYIEQRVQP